MASILNTIDTSKLPPGLLGYDPSQVPQLPAGLLGQQPDPADAPAGGLPPGLLSQLVASQTTAPASPQPSSDPDLGSALDALGIGPNSAAPQPSPGSQLPTPPQLNPGDHLGNVLDHMFLRGTLQKDRYDQYKASLANYQQAMAQRQMQMQMGVAAAAGSRGDDPSVALADPAAYMKTLSDRMAPAVLKPGDTRNFGNGTDYTAPIVGFDDKSGSGYTVNGNSGALASGGQALGGDISAKDGVAVSGRTGLTGQTYGLPQVVAAGSAPGSYTPPLGGAASLPQVGQPPAAAAPGGAPPPGGGLDPKAFFKSFILPHEGGLNPSDMNGSPTKYGINQAANPGVDVRNLTPDQAADIFTKKYFGPSGAGSLPPALAAVHADTAYINPSKANQFLQQSGGDPSKYLQLRQQWMQGMVANNPKAAPYAKAWANRNADLAKIVAGGAPQATQAGSATPAAGWSMTGPAASESGPMDVPGLPGKWQQAPTGKLTHLDGTGMTTDDGLKMGKAVLDDPSYRQAQESGAAFNAMLSLAAQKPGGMRAYALRDTFARTINPGAVARSGTIEAIKNSQGIPAQLQAFFLNMKGDGDVPPEIVKQILAAAAPFAQSHWDAANALNQHFSGIAKDNGLDPRLATAPLGDRPALPGSQPAGGQAGLIARAKAAVAAGADPAQVRDRLAKQYGITGAL